MSILYALDDPKIASTLELEIYAKNYVVGGNYWRAKITNILCIAALLPHTYTSSSHPYRILNAFATLPPYSPPVQSPFHLSTRQDHIKTWMYI